MTYIVMNNGCYGLTKGQFSATNDKTSPSKKGEANPFEAIDLCQMAIQLGAGFVARSFSGDKTQLIPLIKAAISYNGFAFLDVISPCVTFNNHPTSTKSYDYVRAHNMASENKLDYVEPKEEITVDYAEGTSAAIALHDGSRLVLHKLDAAHDPRDADAAIMAIRTNASQGRRWRPACSTSTRAQQDMHDILATDARPLNALPMAELCPGSKALEAINAPAAVAASFLPCRGPARPSPRSCSSGFQPATDILEWRSMAARRFGGCASPTPRPSRPAESASVLRKAAAGAFFDDVRIGGT